LAAAEAVGEEAAAPLEEDVAAALLAEDIVAVLLVEDIVVASLEAEVRVGALLDVNLMVGGIFGNSNSNGGFQPPNMNGARSSGCGGIGCGCLIVILVLVAILIMFSFLYNRSNISDGNSEVTKSTVLREPLPAGSVNETEYYTDELGWINNPTKLKVGLKNFYKKTGVQPYLYITDTVNGTHNPSSEELDLFANDLYDELFTDEAHILLVFFEYNDSYMDRYVCGTQAKTVVDQEAADILLDYIDKYYYDSSISDEEFFSTAFDKAGDRIMAVTKSPWITVWLIIGAVVLVVVLFVWWGKAKKQKNLEAEQTKKILETPLDEFGNQEAEELSKKYNDIDDNIWYFTLYAMF